MHKSFALLLTSALALSACAPSLQDAPVGTAVTPPIEWRTQLGASAPVEAAWWESFGDPQPSRLVEQARLNNPDVRIAAARVDEARATEQASRGYLLPSLGVGVEGGVQREVSALGRPQESVAAQPTFRASYELDLFGKNAARVDAADVGEQGAGVGLGDEGVALSRQDVEAAAEVGSRQIAAQCLIECHRVTVRAGVGPCAAVGSGAYPTDGEERSTGMPDVADAVVIGAGIAGDHAVPVAFGDVRDVVAPGDAGDVAEDVEAPVVADDTFHGSVAFRPSAHVADDRVHRPDRLGSRRKAILVDVEADDRCPLVGEADRRGPADA